MFGRITVDPKQMSGAPCIRHLRIPVATVVGMVADGMTHEEILQAYPDLEPEDIGEALLAGAVVVIEETRIRVRMLPIASPGSP